jgi:hypothetical protein
VGGGWRAPRRSGETFCGRARWRRQTRGSRRLREIADAAARKAAAFANLEDQEPGPWWLRQSGLPGGVLSYELRPGGNRPGPSVLWAGFDAAVELLEVAMESRSVSAEQLALEHLSLVMHEIADALVNRNIYPWPNDWKDRGGQRRG